MRQIIFKRAVRAEMRELSENAWDSREMRETWRVCRGHSYKLYNPILDLILENFLFQFL